MISAGGLQIGAYAVLESAFATPPSSPVFSALRLSSGGLRTNKQTVAINNIYADRNVTDVIEVGQDTSGSYTFDLAYGALDDIFFAPALMSAWHSNIIVNGIRDQSLTIEEQPDNGGVLSYRRFTGCKINTLKLEFNAASKAIGGVDIIGSREVVDTVPLVGATYPHAYFSIGEPSFAISNMAFVGLSPSPIITKISLQISNGATIIHDASSLYGRNSGVGQCEVTGSFSAYFENRALYQKMLDHASGPIIFTVGKVSGARYTFTLPNARLLDGAMARGGRVDDLIATIPFQSLYDATTGGSIMIARGVA